MKLLRLCILRFSLKNPYKYKTLIENVTQLHWKRIVKRFRNKNLLENEDILIGQQILAGITSKLGFLKSYYIL